MLLEVRGGFFAGFDPVLGPVVAVERPRPEADGLIHEATRLPCSLSRGFESKLKSQVKPRR
jgi:hypothetical protein